MSSFEDVAKATELVDRTGPTLEKFTNSLRAKERELEQLKSRELCNFENQLALLKREHAKRLDLLGSALFKVRTTLAAVEPVRAKMAEGFRVTLDQDT